MNYNPLILSAFFLVIVVSGTELDQPACDKNSVYKCARSFYKYENLTEAIFPPTSEIKLRNVCREFQVVDTCLTPLRDSCSLYEEYYYLGLDDTFKFLCEEDNIQAYLRHADCLADKDLWSNGQGCLREFLYSYYMYHNIDDICSYVITYLKCNKATVKSTCGSEVANWQYNINRRHLAVVIKDFDCKFNRLSGGSVAAIIVVVVLIVVGVICIVIWACRRKVSECIARARAQHIKHYSTQNNETATDASKHGVEYPVTGYDTGYNQDVTDYRLEYRRDLGDPEVMTGYTTGVTNPGYTGGDSEANSDVTTHHRELQQEGTDVTTHHRELQQEGTDVTTHHRELQQEGTDGLPITSSSEAPSSVQDSPAGNMIPAIQVTDTAPSNDVLI